MQQALADGHGSLVWTCLVLYSMCSCVSYLLIPFFIRRSGATLLNISNVTTVIWSMLSDILLFGKEFQWMYVAAFFFELCGVIVFSMRQPGQRKMYTK
mmetsp:Transcript_24696/g.38432  ORF Transcript_24696/g.38432 Transcript_24696/m.38432 type:complete len:98 (+) Transcript_24696:953-1246(+)